MGYLYKIFEKLERKAEEFSFKNILIYLFAFLYLRQVLETSFQWNLRVGTYLLFWDSVRLLLIDYPVFYINVFLIFALIIKIFTEEKEEKILKLIFLFTPLTLLPPIYDFIFQGGGMRYSYLLQTPIILKNLFSDTWTQYALSFSRGQLIEIITGCFLLLLYISLKRKNLLFLLLFPLPFLLILLLGSPFYISNYILKDRTIFVQGGFLYYRADKVLLYNLLIFLFLTRFFKLKFFEIKLKFSYYSIFSIFGFLTAWQKLDFKNLYFFDYFFIFLIIFLLSIKRENLFSYLISVIIPITFTNVPFIFLVNFYLFENKFFPIFLRDFLLSLSAFYSSSSFLLKTRVLLAYPFFYPSVISLLITLSNINGKLKNFKIILTFLLITGFFLKDKSLFEGEISLNLIKELEIKYNLTNDPAYLYDLWSLYMGKGDLEKVIYITKKLSIEFSPSDYYGKWADLYLLMDEKEKAKEFSIKSKPLGNPFYLLTLGEIILEEDPPSSQKLLEKSLYHKILPLRSLILLEYLYKKQKNLKELKRIEKIKKTLDFFKE